MKCPIRALIRVVGSHPGQMATGDPTSGIMPAAGAHGPAENVQGDGTGMDKGLLASGLHWLMTAKGGGEDPTLPPSYAHAHALCTRCIPAPDAAPSPQGGPNIPHRIFCHVAQVW